MLLLSCTDLARGYDATPLFEGVSFELRAGDRVGLGVGQFGGPFLGRGRGDRGHAAGPSLSTGSLARPPLTEPVPSSVSMMLSSVVEVATRP